MSPVDMPPDDTPNYCIERPYVEELEETKNIQRVIEESNYILKLSENWDEEGAQKVELETWQKMKNFLERYAQGLVNEGKNLNPPAITPVANGGIDLFWKKCGGNSFLIHINPEESYFYFDKALGAGIEKGSLKTEKILNKIFSLMKNFTNDKERNYSRFS